MNGLVLGVVHTSGLAGAGEGEESMVVEGVVAADAGEGVGPLDGIDDRFDARTGLLAACNTKFKLRRGRRRRGYSISDELLRGFNVLGLAEGIISLILHGPGKWRALARKRKKK